MRSAQLPPGDRFFGRIDRFHCECPDCAELIVSQYAPRVATEAAAKRGGKRRRLRSAPYNSLTSTLRCPACFHTFQVGLLLWPVKVGAPINGLPIPPDQQPNARQKLAMREKGVGLYTEERKARGEEVNWYLTTECSCPRNGWDPTCVRHGWEASKAEREEV